MTGAAPEQKNAVQAPVRLELHFFCSDTILGCPDRMAADAVRRRAAPAAFQLAEKFFCFFFVLTIDISILLCYDCSQIPVPDWTDEEKIRRLFCLN